MGNSTHAPGVGLSAAFLGGRDRTLRGVLARDQQRTSDHRPVEVVRMLSPSQALAKDFCNDQVYPIAVDGRRSFAPGEIALAGSYSGTPGEILVAGATAQRRGASAFSVNVQSRSSGFSVAPPPVPPITGKTYLGLYFEEHPSVEDAWRIRAWLYEDAHFVQELRVSNYQFLGPTMAQSWQRIHTLGDTVVWSGAASPFGEPSFFYWNTATADLHSAGPLPEGGWTLGHSGGNGLWAGDQYLYFHVSTAVAIKLHRILLSEIAEDDNFNEPETLIGDGNELTDADLFPVQPMLCATGLDFQVPAIDSETDAVACPYYAGGVWNSGRGRVLVNATSPAALSCGYPVNGNRSARLTAFEGGEQTVGLLGVGPASPEPALIPAAWEMADAEVLSVAPGGQQFALYPCGLADDPASAGRLLRLAVQGSAYGAESLPTRLTLEPGPNDELPHVMLCRD